MSELPDAFDLEQCAHYLRELGTAASPVLPIGEAALALASFERPRVALGRYRQHLATIARAASAFLVTRPDLAALTLRFDVMLVAPLRPPRHMTGMWRSDD